MTTVLELAAHSGVPVETVLRVLLREPTSEAARRKVEVAVQELGLPDYPRPDDHVEVIPAEISTGDDERAGGPVPAQQPQPEAAVLVSELKAVLEELADRVDRERRERVNDLELSTTLVTEGWRNVDRRLGRLEKIVERMDRRQLLEESDAGAEVRRLDDVRRPGA